LIVEASFSQSRRRTRSGVAKLAEWLATEGTEAAPEPLRVDIPRSSVGKETLTCPRGSFLRVVVHARVVMLSPTKGRYQMKFYSVFALLGCFCGAACAADSNDEPRASVESSLSVCKAEDPTGFGDKYWCNRPSRVHDAGGAVVSDAGDAGIKGPAPSPRVGRNCSHRISSGCVEDF
jgi:hypothetical protein